MNVNNKKEKGFSSLEKLIKQNNNLITTAQAEKHGFYRMLLSKYVKEGKLVRYKKGIYGLQNEIEDDMLVLSKRTNNIVFSHETALFLNGLSDRTPFQHSITIPSNSSVSNYLLEKCKCYYIKIDQHKLGLIKIKNTFGNLIITYNKERTICDLLRSRSRIDDEYIIAAIKNYALRKDKDLNLLYKYAKVFNVEKEVKKYMEVIL